MKNYKEITEHAERNSQISRQVVDDFLIYYAASKNRLDKTFERKIKRYRHITTKMSKEWKNILKSQFIAHQIFKADGLIHKYLNHVEVGYRSKQEIEYLRQQKEHPWRYSFSEIIENPYPDFYTMYDLFTGEEYLLYSPSVSQILLQAPDIRIWFNLIGFNGMCMQTYGTVEYFRAFDKRDITFYAREQNPDLETDDDIAAHIEDHPLPYSMLWSGAMTPEIAHDNHLMRYIAARYFDDDFTSELFEKRFSIEYSNNVYRLSLINWDEFPHYAIAYYDEREELLHLTAMTMEGFDKLVEIVNASGYDLPPEPHDNASPGMLLTASDILKQEIAINPFESLFNPDDVQNSGDNEQLDAINRYLELLMEAVNSDKKPDIKKLADKAGIDHATAADITEQVLGRLPW